MGRHSGHTQRLVAVLAALCLGFAGCQVQDLFPGASSQSSVPAQSESMPNEREEEIDLSVYRRGRQPVLFTELTYSRPDPDKMEQEIRALALDILQSTSMAETLGYMEEARTILYDYDTMYTLSDIYSDMDLTDDDWYEEWQFCDDGYTVCEACWDSISTAIGQSAYSDSLLPLWETYDDSLSRISPNRTRSDNLLDQIDAIADEAADIVDSATIQYEGEEYTLDNATGHRAPSVVWYETYGEKLLELYTQMITVGNELARDCYGYSDYAEYLFDTYHRDYTPEMAGRLIADIERDILPLDDALVEYGYWDDIYEEYGSFEDCMETAHTVLAEMNPEMVQALDLMLEYGLYYNEVNEDAYPRAYVIPLATPNVPFMYVPFSDDIVSAGDFTHEFGHYYEIYTMLDDSCMADDVSEIHSQAMTLLYAQTYRELTGESDLLYYNLADAVDTLQSQTFYASIELRAFALQPDEITAETIGQIGFEQSGRFGRGQEHELYARYRWLTNSDVFDEPLQRLCYASSVCVALDLWRLSLEDMDAALQTYEKLVQRDGTHRFLSNVETAGMNSPFADGWTSDLAGDLSGELMPGEIGDAA